MNVHRRRQKTRLNRKRLKDIARGRSAARKKQWRKSTRKVPKAKQQKYPSKKED